MRTKTYRAVKMTAEQKEDFRRRFFALAKEQGGVPVEAMEMARTLGIVRPC